MYQKEPWIYKVSKICFYIALGFIVFLSIKGVIELFRYYPPSKALLLLWITFLFVLIERVVFLMITSNIVSKIPLYKKIKEKKEILLSSLEHKNNLKTLEELNKNEIKLKLFLLVFTYPLSFLLLFLFIRIMGYLGFDFRIILELMLSFYVILTFYPRIILKIKKILKNSIH